MKINLILGSAFVLILLFGMLFTAFATAAYMLDFFDWQVLIGFTIAINFVLWLVSPYIADWTYKIFYHVEWVSIEGLSKRNREVAKFVKEVCKSKNIPVPKIGYIKDDNPTAFAYGSAPFNSRIVFTEGLFTYLNKDEIKSVLAHEIGHIVHLDFIVMTIASTLVQLMYEFYVITRKAALKSSGGSKKGGGKALLLGVAAMSYVFYIIGTYIVLFLNRVREYYADEFSAEVTKNPNLLSMALIKISYGIIKNPEGSEKESRFLKSTRSFGIFDFQLAKTMGLMYLNSVKMKSWKPVEGALLFDIHNPWGWISEISSTHPLTGKRIRRLSNIAKELGLRPAFDFENLVQKYAVDKSKLYKNFFVDLIFHYLPILLPLGFIALVLANAFVPLQIGPASVLLTNFNLIIGFIVISIGIGTLLTTLYSYSMQKSFEETDVADIMDDIYTSLIKGRPVKLRGKIVGKGIPGYIFSEDMMFEDRTGIIYLNYESIIPLLGNLVFAITKVSNLVGKSCVIEGWFVRGVSHWIELNKIYVDQKEITSHVRNIGIAVAVILILIGLFVSYSL